MPPGAGTGLGTFTGAARWVDKGRLVPAVAIEEAPTRPALAIGLGNDVSSRCGRLHDGFWLGHWIRSEHRFFQHILVYTAHQSTTAEFSPRGKSASPKRNP